MKLSVSILIIYAAIIPLSNCKLNIGKWQLQYGTTGITTGILKGTGTDTGTETTTATATTTVPTCTAAQLTALNAAIEAQLANYLTTTATADFLNAFITETLAIIEAAAAAGNRIPSNQIIAQVLGPTLGTFFSTYSQSIPIATLETAITMAIANSIDCTVCVPDRAAILSVINNYLTGNAASTAITAAVTAGLTDTAIENAFDAIFAAGNYPGITAEYNNINQRIRRRYVTFLTDAANIPIISAGILTALNTALTTSVNTGAIGMAIDAALANCMTTTGTGSTTGNSVNTNVCLNGGVFLISWKEKLICLLVSILKPYVTILEILVHLFQVKFSRYL